MVSSTPQPHFIPGIEPVPILQEIGWAPGSVWTGGKSLPTGIRSQTVLSVVGRYNCRLYFRISTLTITRCVSLIYHFVNYKCILWLFTVVLYFVQKVDFEHYSILNSETSKDKRNETDYKNMFFVCVCVCNKCFPFYVVISCIL